MRLLSHICQKKTILDTNIILRYLLNDNEELSGKAREIIRKQRCIAYLEIISEVVFVLQSKEVYNIPRKEIAEQLVNLSYEITIDKNNVLKSALEAYSDKPKLDFVDCLLYGYSKHGYTVATLDKKLNKKLKSE